MTPNHDQEPAWPPIFDKAQAASLTEHNLDWHDETARARFTGQHQHCIWLSSCWPAFAPDHHKDIIAGGFAAWLKTHAERTHEDTQGAQTHQLFLQGTPEPETTAQMPTHWMNAQLLKSNKSQAHLAKPGWYGGLSYSYASPDTGLSQPVKTNQFWPNCQLGFARWVITINEAAKSATLLTQGMTPAEQAELVQLWEESRTQTASNKRSQPQQEPALTISPWVQTLTREAYEIGFRAIKEHICAGDTYQVNFTQRFDAQWQGTPLTGFLQLKQESPSPYAAFWATPHGTVSSHSPELLLTTSGTPMVAVSKPIKGTTPRNPDSQLDRIAATQLRSCPKNRAENTMIVDLLRNDLSHYAAPATMRVPQLCAIESFAHIHHLVSEISTEIIPDMNPMQVLLACFPGGSITGAPKKRAMEIIDELELTPRDIYCGTIGFWDAPNQAIFNITIRTLLFNHAEKTVHIWAGGGIVHDSEVNSEYAECFHKINKLMKCLSANHPIKKP